MALSPPLTAHEAHTPPAPFSYTSALYIYDTSTRINHKCLTDTYIPIGTPTYEENRVPIFLLLQPKAEWIESHTYLWIPPLNSMGVIKSAKEAPTNGWDFFVLYIYHTSYTSYISAYRKYNCPFHIEVSTSCNLQTVSALGPGINLFSIFSRFCSAIGKYYPSFNSMSVWKKTGDLDLCLGKTELWPL